MQTTPSDVNFTYTCRALRYNTKSPYPQSRSKHATCIHDGYLYVAAGKDGNISLRDLWRCQIDTWRWEKVSLRGGVQSHLEGHTLVSCKKLLLLFGGEFGDALTEASLWIINPDLGYVRQSAPDPGCERPCIRRHHSAVVYDGSMFVYGGYVDIKGSSNELWQFRIDDEEWELLSPRQAVHEMPGGRHGHTAVVYKRCMWLFGGMSGLSLRQDLSCYSFAANRWERVKVKVSPPYLTGHSAIVVHDKMLVFGGENNRELVNQLWSFSFCTEKWTQILLNDKIPSPRMFHTSVFITSSPSGDTSVKASSMPFLQRKLNNLHLERPRSSPASDSQGRLHNDERQSEQSLSPKCLNTSQDISQGSVNSAPLPPQHLNLCINSDNCDNLPVLPGPGENAEDQSPLMPKKLDLNFNTVIQLDKRAINNGIDNPGVSHSTEELIRENLHFSRMNGWESNVDVSLPRANFDRSVSEIEKAPSYSSFIRHNSDVVMPVTSKHSDVSAVGDHFSHNTDPSLCDGSFRQLGAKKLKCDPEILVEDLEYNDCLLSDIAIQYPSSRSAFKQFISTESLFKRDSNDIESIELGDFVSREHGNSPYAVDFASNQRRQLMYVNMAAKSMCDIRDNAHEDKHVDNRRKASLDQKSKLCDHSETRDSSHIGESNSPDVTPTDNDCQSSVGVRENVSYDREVETSFQSKCFPTSRQRYEHRRGESRGSKMGPADSSYMLILGGKEVQGTNFSIKPMKMWKLEIKPC